MNDRKWLIIISVVLLILLALTFSNVSHIQSMIG